MLRQEANLLTGEHFLYLITIPRKIQERLQDDKDMRHYRGRGGRRGEEVSLSESLGERERLGCGRGDRVSERL